MQKSMDMEVIGRHALLFDDDAMATFVNSSDALVEWNSIPIDRYDVRHLLSSPPPPRRRRNNHHISDSSETELDQERYLDLSYDQQEPDDDCKPLDAGGYNAVGFSYGKNEDSADQINSDSVLGSSGFIPPFAVPENLVIPPTEKLHQIITRTAVYVSKHGTQSEIVLRVKQGDNPTFGFLMPDHHLHSYFRFLVDNSEVLNFNAEEKPQNEMISDTEPGGGGGALSLLSSLYGLGEDEDGAAELKSEKNVSGGANNVSATVSYMSVETVSPKTVSGDATSNHIVKSQDKVLAKPKDKVLVVKRNSFTSGLKASSGSGTRKEGESFGSLSATRDKLESSSVASTSIIDSSVLEPPSEMKKLIAKIVEFIMKNGKQFEAVLVEQDSEHGRFPFLLPSNQYNLYYLKVLQEAQKAKVSGRDSFNEKDGSGLHKSNKKNMFAKGSVLSSLEPRCDIPFDSDRKEKFKMVIGKSKNDGQDPPSKANQEQSEIGVDAAAAAAILQAATRGVRTPNLNFLSRSSLNRKDNSSEGGHASSLGSIPSSQAQNGARCSAPVVKEIAKTAALEAASEADSHEAHLTKEQKLKAERLRRAKMFVAMIKSGSATQIKPESSHSVELCPVGGDAEVPQAGKEREGSSAPLEVDKTENIESSAKKFNTDEYNERKARRKYRSISTKYETAKEDIDDEEDEVVHKHSRKHHREDVDEREIKNSRKKHRYHASDDASDQDRHEKDRKYSKKHHRSHKSSHDKDEREEDYDDDEMHHKYSRKHHRSHKSSDDEDEREEEDYDDEKDHKYSRKHHRSYKSSHDEDEEDHEERRSRKKHRSRRSSHHSRHRRSSHHSRHHSKDSHSHRHRKRHRSSKDKESRHRNKHDLSSDEEQLHGIGSDKLSGKVPVSEHRNKHDLSSDEEKLRGIGSDKLSGKVPVSEREDLEEGEISAKLSDQSRGSVGGGSHRESSIDISSSFQNKRSSSQPSEPTEISDDLRAKIRAMLLETL